MAIATPTVDRGAWLSRVPTGIPTALRMRLRALESIYAQVAVYVDNYFFIFFCKNSTASTVHDRSCSCVVTYK